MAWSKVQLWFWNLGIGIFLNRSFHRSMLVFDPAWILVIYWSHFNHLINRSYPASSIFDHIVRSAGSLFQSQSPRGNWCGPMLKFSAHTLAFIPVDGMKKKGYKSCGEVFLSQKHKPVNESLRFAAIQADRPPSRRLDAGHQSIIAYCWRRINGRICKINSLKKDANRIRVILVDISVICNLATKTGHLTWSFNRYVS